MANCNVSHLPNEIWRLQSLETWHLGGNNLCSLPDGISNLTRLLYFYLDKSARLQSLPNLPLGLSNLYAEDCALLENIELKGAVRTNMFLYGCHKLAGNNFANEFINVFTEHKEKNCGAYLIYEVDQNITETNDEALTQYTSSPYQSVILEGKQEKEVDYPAKRS
ncbi:hypothetical protein ACSBR1_032491 [Camellia fascicularis]